MITVEARAKINLTLEVLGKRPDGYHNLRSVIQTLVYGDILQFSPADAIVIKSDMPDWVAEQSLVAKAVKVLQESTGCTAGAVIEIKKRIPLMSGLGGDSSDAASVFGGLNQLWELGLSEKELSELGSRLGSDVPFFFYGGIALLTGRGERITPLPPLPHRWVILVIPDVSRLPGKTKRLYSMLNSSHYTDGKITDKLVTDLKSGQWITDSELFNIFENVVFARGEELTDYRDHILKIGAPHIHLAGSGPTMFALFDNKSQAEDLLKKLNDPKMTTFLTETIDSSS